MTLSPYIQQGSVKGEKPLGTLSKSLLSYHHSSKILFKHVSRLKLNTDEGITQYWKRVTNKLVPHNRAVFIKMRIKGQIATLESIGICKGLCPNITCSQRSS